MVPALPVVSGFHKDQCLVIGIGTGPACPVLAGPLFPQFYKIHYRCIKEWHACLLELDQFRSPSYTPVGPVLFFIYINDVTCVVSNGKIIIYADDIALYQVIHSPNDFILVQQNFNSYLHVGQSKLSNTLKYCYLSYSRKPTPTLLSSPLLVNNTVLHMVKEFF